MAIFAKDGKPVDARTAPAEAVLSIIAAGMHVVGDLEGEAHSGDESSRRRWRSPISAAVRR